jgi:hypothetical protein
MGCGREEFLMWKTDSIPELNRRIFRSKNEADLLAAKVRV